MPETTRTTTAGELDMVDEELEMDSSAYEMYHQAQTTSPCLSFDVIGDDYGKSRTDYPHTCFFVAGTQAEKQAQNSLIVIKASNLRKTFKEEDDSKSNSDDSDSDSEDEDEKPELEAALLNHSGCVNRVRCSPSELVDNKRLAATWSEIGKVFVWDLSEPLSAVADAKATTEFVKKQSHAAPVFQFGGHQTEGFALDWSPIVAGQLVTGDCAANIHVWTMSGAEGWHVDQRPYTGHKASVEDLQWSPNEPTVFASCSVDKSIRVWDTRASPAKANMITCDAAHDSDVNVINWNRNEPFIVSGGDDAVIKVWDLRLFDQKKPVAVFKHHTKPITSVEWNTNDSTVFAASSEDNQLTIWDLAVEKDEAMATSSTDNNNNNDADDKLKDIPEQLLFIHQGQKEMKELHWHPQIPGLIISTAHTGFNIFKTISV